MSTNHAKIDASSLRLGHTADSFSDFEDLSLGMMEEISVFEMNPSQKIKERTSLWDGLSRLGVLEAKVTRGLRMSPAMSAPAIFDLAKAVLASYVAVTPTNDTPLTRIHEIFRLKNSLNIPLVVVNHNQDHLTGGGLVRAVDMKPLVDSGALLGLNLSNLFWSKMHGARSESEWLDRCEQEFTAFLGLLPALVYVSTVSGLNGKSHVFSGVSIVPWLRRIIDANKNVLFIAESGHFSVADKHTNLKNLLTKALEPEGVENKPQSEAPVAAPKKPSR